MRRIKRDWVCYVWYSKIDPEQDHNELSPFSFDIECCTEDEIQDKVKHEIEFRGLQFYGIHPSLFFVTLQETVRIEYLYHCCVCPSTVYLNK